jgi:hypothetical protein
MLTHLWRDRDRDAPTRWRASLPFRISFSQNGIRTHFDPASACLSPIAFGRTSVTWLHSD